MARALGVSVPLQRLLEYRRDGGREGGIRHDAAHAVRLSDNGVAAESHAISANVSRL